MACQQPTPTTALLLVAHRHKYQPEIKHSQSSGLEKPDCSLLTGTAFVLDAYSDRVFTAAHVLYEKGDERLGDLAYVEVYADGNLISTAPLLVMGAKGNFMYHPKWEGNTRDLAYDIAWIKVKDIVSKVKTVSRVPRTFPTGAEDTVLICGFMRISSLDDNCGICGQRCTSHTLHTCVYEKKLGSSQKEPPVHFMEVRPKGELVELPLPETPRFRGMRFSKADTRNGMSGGPWSDAQHVFAVHGGACNSTTNGRVAYGVSLSPGVLASLGLPPGPAA